MTTPNDVQLPKRVRRLSSPADELQSDDFGRVGRWTILRPVQEEDLSFLYALATDPVIGYRWRYRGEVPSMGAFVRNRPQQQNAAEFVVVDKRTGARIGEAVIHSLNLRDRTAYIAQAIVPSLMGQGWAAEAGRLLISYAFATWDLRKIYAESAAYNIASFDSRQLFAEEGRLREHLFHSGRYYDAVILALTRADWAAEVRRTKAKAEQRAELKEAIVSLLAGQ